MIEKERLSKRNDAPERQSARYVLYWMQQSQRAESNPALEHAIDIANRLDLPLLTVFALTDDYPEANRRHFAFMLEGLAETSEALAERDIRLLVRHGAPPDVVSELVGQAACVVCDTGYLRHQREWRTAIADAADVRVVQVESDVVVPVETASDKREWAARTIRSRINDRRDDFVRQLRPVRPRQSSLGMRFGDALNLSDWRGCLDALDVDHDVPAVSGIRPGTRAARRRLTQFLRNGLPGYADARNDPADPQGSMLSPSLHFGQISPVEIAFKVRRAAGPDDDDKAAFLEELIVRRELACNFVWFSDDYDRYSCLPEWARKTLAEHEDDERPARYTRRELERARTGDPYWNAAMQEMLKTGYMHNYMRMYWGKKIIEWSNTPEYAYRTALYLNNRYFLDGRDPNSYANVGWLFGLHDRAWTERDVFGKVRYMNARGLESKFDIDGYVQRVDAIPDADD